MSGVVIRALVESSDHDLALAFDLIRACEVNATGSSDATHESVAAQLTGPDSLAGTHRIAFVNDRPVGLLALEHVDGSDEVFVDAYCVGPRAGEIQRLLLAEGRRTASGLPGVRTMSAACFDVDHDYQSALGDQGMREVRRFWRMRQDLSGAGSLDPAAPGGVSVRAARSAPDRATLHAMREECFAGHFGHQRRTLDGYLAALDSAPGADPDAQWIVLRNGAPIGLCILDDSRAAFDEGYVRTLGIVPAARGRGVARWLLGCAAAYAVRRGRRANALTVDGQNTTGATALYTSVGYEVREVVCVWERTLP